MGLPTVPILRKALRSYQIFGANTEVGKTVWSTILCNAARKRYPSEKIAYLKPVSTGPEDEKDDCHINRFTTGIHTKTLVQYGIPVSPHLAASASSQGITTDHQILSQCAHFAATELARQQGWLFIETAGGVNSPAPSGTTQADLYMPLRAPVVLVGDSKLGGISLSISAYESLRMRGYDVESIVLFRNDKWGNSQYLAEYFRDRGGVPVTVIEEPPAREGSKDDKKAMGEYYESLGTAEPVGELLGHLERRHDQRMAGLERMADEADRHLWYPFTQHTTVKASNIRVIESARGDFFNTVEKKTDAADEAVLKPTFDGSASWWTQGLGHGNPALTLAAAYAAGRYGHVMYPGMVHEPAMSLAKVLLEGLENPRLNRVFYSDNGSTGAEIAVKMALRATRLRYGWSADDHIEILGLKGAYHGDTMGAMDCSEPGTFNKKVEWYQGKGFWFDVPGVLCSEGKWTVTGLEDGISNSTKSFDSLEKVFDVEGRIANGEHEAYRALIESTLSTLQAQGRKFGALMMEPIILGAGGMILVDPLFQRTLVDTVRQRPDLFASNRSQSITVSGKDKWSGLPVVFDEVFTGLYRLGRFSSASFLGTKPDISVHAKLLTGGLIPLCATLASEQIFECFLSDDKSDALLHGHSYTAHAVGCQVALESVKQLQDLDTQGHWNWAKSAQKGTVQKVIEVAASAVTGGRKPDSGVWSVWSPSFVDTLSRNVERITGIWALGSVLAIHMRDDGGSGYSSSVSKGVQEALLNGGSHGAFDVHCRVLGNVLYVMTGQRTEEEVVKEMQRMIQDALARPL